MKRLAGKKVRFELEAEPGSKAFVAGTFNNWDPTKTPMKQQPRSGTFARTVVLSRGRHEYKFVVNDTWRADPRCPEWVLNDCGSMNSVLKVGESVCGS